MTRWGSADEPGGQGNHAGKPGAGRKRKRKWIPKADQPTRAERPATPPRRTPPQPRSRNPWAARGPSGGQAPRRPDSYDEGVERYDRRGYPRDPNTPRTEPFGPSQHGQSQHGGHGGHGGHGAQREPGGSREPGDGHPRQDPHDGPTAPRMPKKLTVTRVAALRSRQLSRRMYDAFHRAHNADGADQSGLTQLSWSVMLNYASDAAMALALANTLFFSPTSAESSRSKIALYLLITIAPFALVAPVIGPALDRLQRGRRLAMSLASAGQALACVVMALNFDSWLLYPAALAKMVLSKSFTVLKSAVTPRVVPPDITLSKTNARLTVFGLAAGGAGGAVAAGVNQLFGSAGALWFTMAICAFGAWQAMRIPAWVEVTEGEVPAALSSSARPRKKPRQPMGPQVTVSLWANGTVRVLTGFLMMFAAFAVKDQAAEEPFVQLLLLGLIGGAAGLGGFVGNAIGARLQFGKPDQVVLGCVFGTLASTVLASIVQGVVTAAIVGLVGSTASALAKISLDAVIQNDLPEESRASAFGRSETVLQLSWVFGGAIGLLLPPTYWIGFLTVSGLLLIGGVQTVLVRRGGSMLPRRDGPGRAAGPSGPGGPAGPAGASREAPAYSAHPGPRPGPDAGDAPPSPRASGHRRDG